MNNHDAPAPFGGIDASESGQSPETAERAFRRWFTEGDGVDHLRAELGMNPAPGPGQVLIQVEALALNFRDLLVINGKSTWRPQGAVTPISDAAGTIVGLGPGVTRFRGGERVSPMFLPYWRTGDLTAEVYHSPIGGPIMPGVLADMLVVDQDQVEIVPATLDAAQAATLPVAALTAWHAVAVRCQVQPGDHVLVHGTGGVSLFALQFATALGAHVAVTTSKRERAAQLAELSASKVIDYRQTPDIAPEVLAWTKGRGVDHVIETVGGSNLNHSLRSVRIGGSIAFIGLLAGLSAPISTYEFVTKNIELHGIETGSAEMYRHMAAFIDEHHVEPVIDSTVPLHDVHSALRRLERGEHFGKVVLLGDR